MSHAHAGAVTLIATDVKALNDKIGELQLRRYEVAVYLTPSLFRWHYHVVMTASVAKVTEHHKHEMAMAANTGGY